eukprot:GHVU01151563.1.p1 GENE.GHVU01151563.1~~GHVU01151563.1.p1  ORF type:complete len:191 (-),score=53.26 GHVU01151563.1:303-875(-)
MGKVSAELQKISEESVAAAQKIISNKKTMEDLWMTLDMNDNKDVSLAEIDRMVVLNANNPKDPYEGFFKGMNNKRALMRAYKHTIRREGNKDEYVQKNEFPALLRNLWFYTQLWKMFDDMDADNDQRVDLEEFTAAAKALKLKNLKKPADFKKAFDEIDTNGGGVVLFAEFCEWSLKELGMGDCKDMFSY